VALASAFATLDKARVAADLAALPPAVARDVGTVVLERLVRELNGIECDDLAGWVGSASRGRIRSGASP
jgi:hypothetical protein